MPDIELTSAELDELERLAKAATPRPWTYGAQFICSNPSHGEYVELAQVPLNDYDSPRWNRDAKFVAAARNNFARLLSLARAGLEAGKAEESMREQIERVTATPSERFAAWIGEGPRLAKAAGVYVGITVYDQDPTAIRALPLTGDKT